MQPYSIVTDDIVKVVGTGKSPHIKNGVILTMHRNVALKLIKKGSVKMEGEPTETIKQTIKKVKK